MEVGIQWSFSPNPSSESKIDCRLIAPAHEMVEPLERDTTKIKMPGHSTWFSGSFEQIYLMAFFDCLVCCGEAHWARTYNDNTRH